MSNEINGYSINQNALGKVARAVNSGHTGTKSVATQHNQKIPFNYSYEHSSTTKPRAKARFAGTRGHAY